MLQREIAISRRGAADRGEYRQAAGFAVVTPLEKVQNHHSFVEIPERPTIKHKYIVWFELPTGHREMFGSPTLDDLIELIRDLPREARQCSRIGFRTLQ